VRPKFIKLQVNLKRIDNFAPETLNYCDEKKTKQPGIRSVYKLVLFILPFFGKKMHKTLNWRELKVIKFISEVILLSKIIDV